MKRRDLAIGAGGIIGIGSLSISLLTFTDYFNDDESILFRGVTYETNSNVIQGDAICTKRVRADKISLMFDIPGHFLEIEIDKTGEEINRFHGEVSNHDFSSGEILINGALHGDHLDGYITKRDRQYSELGFNLISEHNDMDSDEIKLLYKDPDSNKEVNVPDSGIPKSNN